VEYWMALRVSRLSLRAPRGDSEQALNSIDLIGRLLSITRVPKLTC
jgi:hypothetical protein